MAIATASAASIEWKGTLQVRGYLSSYKLPDHSLPSQCILQELLLVIRPPSSPSTFTPHGAPRPLSFASNFAGLLRTGRLWAPAGIAHGEQGRAYKHPAADPRKQYMYAKICRLLRDGLACDSLRQPAYVCYCFDPMHRILETLLYPIIRWAHIGYIILFLSTPGLGRLRPVQSCFFRGVKITFTSWRSLDFSMHSQGVPM